MLGQPVSMLIPEVVGFKLTGRMVEGTTATDLVLKVVQMLRKKGVVGKFVEFYGEGLDHLPLADRATIANMAPEYGATCGFFPIDGETLRYLRNTGRDEDRIALVEAYAKANGMWRGAGLRADLHRHAAPRHGRDRSGDLRPEAAAGLHAAEHRGRRLLPDRRRLSRHRRLERRRARWRPRAARPRHRRAARGAQDRDGRGRGLHHPRRLGGDRGDHLLHQHLEPLRDDRRRPRRPQGARARPEPQAVGEDLAGAGQSRSSREYLEAAGLQEDLDAIGFNLAGYGCTTCIGNSGPLGDPAISKAIAENDLVATAVLSGNRNFEGRISPDVRANYLASPPLVVAYALAGDVNIDLTSEPLGDDAGRQGRLPQGHLADATRRSPSSSSGR